MKTIASERRRVEERIMELQLDAGERMLVAGFHPRFLKKWKADLAMWEHWCFAAAMGRSSSDGWTAAPTKKETEIDWESDPGGEWLHWGARAGRLPPEHEEIKRQRDQEDFEGHVATFNGAHKCATGKTESDEDVEEWVK